MSTRYFALILGIIYLLVGILGFLPFALSTPPASAPSVSVTTLYGYLLGIFPVNVLHSIVHLIIGIWGILAYRSFNASRSFAGVVAALFAVLTIMGLIPGLNTTFGLIPLFSNDIWLHAITALAAAYFAFAAPSERPTMAM
jgi:hypothetical protein